MAPIFIAAKSQPKDPSDNFPTKLSAKTDNNDLENEKKSEEALKEGENDGSEPKTIKQLFDDFVSGLTLHGFRFLFVGSLIRRILWFLITTSVFSFSIILFNGLFSDFLLRKTMVSSNKEFVETSLDFPTITVCPNNQYNTRKIQKLAEAYGKTPKEFVDLLNGFKWDTGPYSQESLDLINFLENEGLSSYYDFVNETKVTWEDVKDTPALRSLLFSSTCDFYEDECRQDEVKQTIWTFLGVENSCFQFNPYNSTKTLSIGKVSNYYSGLNLLIDISENMLYGTSMYRGVVVYITPYGDDHRYLSSAKSIDLKGGESTIIKITEKEFTHLPAPYKTDCGEVDIPMIDSSRQYTKGLCLINCQMIPVYEKCGCLREDFRNVVRDDIKICSLRDDRCFSNETSGDTFLDNFFACVNQCPQECVETVYDDMFISTSSIGGDEEYHMMLQIDKLENKTIQDAEKYLKENFIMLHVSFIENIRVKEELTPAVSWVSLIANMGGAIGLGLGFSFITAFEFIFFIIDACVLLWKQKLSGKNKIGAKN